VGLLGPVQRNRRLFLVAQRGDGEEGIGPGSGRHAHPAVDRRRKNKAFVVVGMLADQVHASGSAHVVPCRRAEAGGEFPVERTPVLRAERFRRSRVFTC